MNAPGAESQNYIDTMYYNARSLKSTTVDFKQQWIELVDSAWAHHS
jgi:hypothetical protein